MASSALRLIYLDLRGRAEVTRILLAAAGKEYEDVRYQRDEFPAVKHKMPFHQVPVLEIDGKAYAQSYAIARFLAGEFGFDGRTNLENLRLDMVAQLWEDLDKHAYEGIKEKDPVRKAEIQKSVREGTGLDIQGFLEKLLDDNKTGFFVGDRLTLADMYAFDMHTGGLGPYLGSTEKFPLLKANLEKVQSHEKIAAYLKVRK